MLTNWHINRGATKIITNVFMLFQMKERPPIMLALVHRGKFVRGLAKH